MLSMNVGNSVQHSLDEWERGDWPAAMLHACNAVDGTSKKRYPDRGVGDRFKQVIRDELDILNLLGVPGINLELTRFPVPVASRLSDRRPDIADIIYGIHRCCHSHGEDLPSGFELTAPQGNSQNPSVSIVSIEKRTIALPASTIIGLLGVAVFAPENGDQSIPVNYYLTVQNRIFVIADWWGWGDHFRAIAATLKLIKIEMIWGDWWDDWKPFNLT